MPAAWPPGSEQHQGVHPTQMSPDCHLQHDLSQSADHNVNGYRKGQSSPPLTANGAPPSDRQEAQDSKAQTPALSVNDLVHGLNSLTRKDIVEVFKKTLPVDALGDFLEDQLDRRELFSVLKRVLSVENLVEVFRHHIVEEDLFMVLRDVLSTRHIFHMIGELPRKKRIEVLQETAEQLDMSTDIGDIEKIDNRTAVVLQAFTRSDILPAQPKKRHGFEIGDIIKFHELAPTSDPSAQFNNGQTTPSPGGLMISKPRPFAITSIDETTQQAHGYVLSTNGRQGMRQVQYEERRRWQYLVIEEQRHSDGVKPQENLQLNLTGHPPLEVENIPSNKPWKAQSHLDTLSPIEKRLNEGQFHYMGRLTQRSLHTLLEDNAVNTVRYTWHVIEEKHGGSMNIDLVKEFGNASELTADDGSRERGRLPLDVGSNAMTSATSTKAKRHKSDAASKATFSAAGTSTGLPNIPAVSTRREPGKRWSTLLGIEAMMSIFTRQPLKRRGSAALSQSSGRPNKIPRPKSTSSLADSATRGSQAGPSNSTNNKSAGSNGRPPQRRR